MDLTSLYPASLHAAVPLFAQIRAYYHTTYKDRFFAPSGSPLWFRAFIVLEAVYHVPLSVWAVGALLRDDPQVPVQLLVFALEAALTTVPCLAEVVSWAELSGEERGRLLGMYGAYLAVSVGMGVDCFLRIRSVLGRAGVVDAKKRA